MPKVAPWRLAILAILAKIARGLAIMAINLFIAIIVRPLAIFSKIASLQGATFGIQFKSPEAGDFSPFSPLLAIFAKIANFATIAGDLNWMPKVAL